jgi:predicted GH43/DUF377 family glycosyl hydrolase
MAPEVLRRDEQFVSDDRRVLPRYLDFGRPPRIRSIFRRLMMIPESHLPEIYRQVCENFAGRHRDLDAVLEDSFQQAARHMRPAPQVSSLRRRVIGGYFTMEYSIESAALFNPSIVPHPNQEGVPEGALRFLMSLRATGEGHVSSIVFRRGVIEADGSIRFDPPPRYAHASRPIAEKRFDKATFRSKLRDLGEQDVLASAVLDALPERFSRAQLAATLNQLRSSATDASVFKRVCGELDWLAAANYELRFPEDCQPAEMVIFPATSHEGRGMEDLRLTRLVEPDGQVRYCGTYTAFDGRRTHPMMLETLDFRSFHVHTLTGRYVKNKGQALFPRQVNGSYLMLSRHDGENLFLMRSQNLFNWNVSMQLQGPVEDWELVQIGNCGSPLETDEGWLVLTHGVGPMRRYCIGAILLDLEDPSRVIGRLKEPLMAPTAEEREGYVPNVLYSCGSLIHNGRLVVPYAMSDVRTAFATVDMGELLGELKSQGPGWRKRRKKPAPRKRRRSAAASR